ncbi:hypothetical protein APHAL10511_008388 [Amanita phalloides]|nr:hypothetical protein APHAL10511_008388 [Amanita phalloides]
MERDDRIPPPAYRHAAPSAPWPWVDARDYFDRRELESTAPPAPEDCDHTECNGDCWKEYPKSRFPNWTETQVKKCKIHAAIHNYDHRKKCIIHKLDVNKKGIFCDAEKFYMEDDEGLLDREWDRFRNDNQGNIRVRALFVENMSGPALRMLGGKYNIEPFFFSSSLNWIPSHFQANPRPGIGDQITITLPFIQSVNESLVPPLQSGQVQEVEPRGHIISVSRRIDTQAPLRLASNQRVLVLDLLSVHLIRNIAGNIIISYHANAKLPTTKADYLHERILFAGQSVYWQKMLENADDPVLLLLIFIWHAMYAWDEALQHLYEHVCTLETEVIKTSSMKLTEELHTIRSHLLHYASLLAEFQKIVEFILDTRNPALTTEQRKASDDFLERECSTLLGAIERLDKERLMQGERLENVIRLVFSSVNISDSKSMQRMTKATIRDSVAVSRISYT